MLLNEPSDYYGNNSLIKEIIIYQAGVDALKSDRLGRLKLSRETLQKRNEIVYECASKGVIVLMMEEM